MELGDSIHEYSVRRQPTGTIVLLHYSSCAVSSICVTFLLQKILLFKVVFSESGCCVNASLVHCLFYAHISYTLRFHSVTFQITSVGMGTEYH